MLIIPNTLANDKRSTRRSQLGGYVSAEVSCLSGFKVSLDRQLLELEVGDCLWRWLLCELTWIHVFDVQDVRWSSPVGDLQRCFASVGKEIVPSPSCLPAQSSDCHMVQSRIGMSIRKHDLELSFEQPNSCLCTIWPWSPWAKWNWLDVVEGVEFLELVLVEVVVAAYRLRSAIVIVHPLSKVVECFVVFVCLLWEHIHQARSGVVDNQKDELKGLDCDLAMVNENQISKVLGTKTRQLAALWSWSCFCTMGTLIDYLLVQIINFFRNP